MKKTFSAYDASDSMPGGQKHTNQLSQMLKVWMVCGDCLLIGLAPVLVHMAKDPETQKFAFSPVSVNLLVEIVKTIFALGTLAVYGCGRPGPPLYRSFRAFCNDAYHNRLLAIPGALYAVNNYLKFIMQLYFKPTTAKMLSNLKIIVIALLMRSVMRRRFSVFQWEALFLLVAGITVNQLASPNCDGTATAAVKRGVPGAKSRWASTIAAPPEPIVNDAIARLSVLRVVSGPSRLLSVRRTSGPPSSPATISAARIAPLSIICAASTIAFANPRHALDTSKEVVCAPSPKLWCTTEALAGSKKSRHTELKHIKPKSSRVMPS